ncbi:MAG: hypothetical protein EOM37_04650 [Proteobacteria bacterium]|nr:hypothetical protein [Pseudomonadota bacterium]
MTITPDHVKGTLQFATKYLLPSRARELRQLAREKTFASASQQGTPANQSSQTQDFSGKAGPGYEVELYRNDVLLAFQYTNAAGRYAFSNIPVLFGDNDFRVLVYGPQGQYGEKKMKVAGPPSPELSTKQNISQPVVEPPARKVEEKKKKEIRQAQTTMTASTGIQFTPVQASNWQSLDVIRSDQKLGSIDAYIGARGVFLRLDAFLRFSGNDFSQRTSSTTIEMSAEDGERITLDLDKREYADAQGKHSLFHNDAFMDENIIYANTDLIYRLFPHAAFIVDQSRRRLRLPEKEEQKHELPKHDVAELAPAPSAAPVAPVIIDDQKSMAALPSQSVGKVEPAEAQDVLHLEESGTHEEGKRQADTESSGDGEPLILAPKIKSARPDGNFVEAMDYSGQVYLPFNDLIQILDFPIKVEKDETEASGFSFTPDNEFTLSLSRKEVRYDGKTETLKSQDIQVKDGRLYVNVESFAAWFGIKCTVNREQGVLQLETDKLFPQEASEERRNQWNKLLSVTKPKDDDLPLLENPYRLVGYPSIDVDIGSYYRHSVKNSQTKNYTSNYNVQGAMDLGYMTSQFYAQGSTDHRALQNFRLVLGREDPTSQLLGPLRATSFAVGDITLPSVSFATVNSNGRGATLTNRDVSMPDNFDVHSFTGVSVPGHEVELYRNNILVAFQQVDSSGRYNFTDIPILYGQNVFRLVFYGPQGQTEERVETISASNAMLQQGKFEYTFGADERNVNLLGPRKTEDTRLPNAPQYVGSFRYGLTPDFTLGISMAQTELEDGTHRYAVASTNASLAGVLAEFTAARDLTAGGWAGGVSALGGFEDVSLRARYRHYKDFVSEAVNYTEEPLRSEAQLDANSQFYLPVIQGFTLGISSLRETFVDTQKDPRWTQGVQLSKSFWGLSFSNKLDYIYNGERTLRDTFGLQTRLWNISFRTTGIYDFAPTSGFHSTSVAADYRLTDKLTAQSQIERDMSTRDTSFGQSMIWDFDAFRLSFNNFIDTNGNYSVGMNVLFSLVHNPSTNKWQAQPQQTSSGGAVAGRIFSDVNGNGVYDEGEKLFPDAAVRVNRLPVKMDEGGYFVAPVAPYNIAKVELNASSIDDPLISPKTNGYRVRTRPGDVVVADFPLVQTTIIDGNSYFLEKNGERRPLGNIVVELTDKDKKILKRVISDAEGYYTFENVEKGEYWLSVPDDVLSQLNAMLRDKVHVVVDRIDNFVTGQDVVIEQKADLSVPPPDDVVLKQK